MRSPGSCLGPSSCAGIGNNRNLSKKNGVVLSDVENRPTQTDIYSSDENRVSAVERC
ncbi:MAG: hypothetical protein J6X92_04480 [Bacteroidales bacterium]|nr:hypothetical protein [Bacteroidales bacterium]